MSTVRVAFVAGRYDADHRAFAKYVRRVVRRGKAQAFATTETYGKGLFFLRALMPLWSIQREGEYVIGVKRTAFATTRWSSVRRFSFEYDDHDEWRDLFAGRRRVVHRKTSRPCLPGGAHAPSHVEYGEQWRPNRQAEAHRLGTKRLGDTLARAEARQPTPAIWLGIDTNVDHHMAVWRERVETALGMPSCWSEDRPGAGTHGARLIDAIYANVPMSDARISPVRRPPKVDHRAVLVTLDLGAPRSTEGADRRLAEIPI